MSLSKDLALLRRNDCNDSETGGDGLCVKSRGNRVFDIEAFHQLRLERLENQRKAEHERMQRRVLRSTPRVRVDMGSKFRSPSSVVDFPLRTDIPQSPNIAKAESFQASVIAEEMNDQIIISSARQDLIRLGRRYASSQGGRLMTGTHAKVTSSHERSTPFLDDISFDSTTTASSRIIDNLHLPTEGIGVQGMYLLLARSNFPPNHHDHIENDIIDDEDGSASESYSTPTAPYLQTYLDCDECHHQQDDKKLDPFSSFCAAQLLLSEMEEKLLKQPKQVPVHLHKADHDNAVQQKKKKMDQGKSFFIIFLLIVLAGLTSLNWFRRVQLHFISKMISIHYNTCQQFMQGNYWTMTLRFQTLMDQLSSLREHNMTQCLLSLVKARWSVPSGMFTEWSFDIIRISCVKCIHFLHTGFRDTLATAIAAKYRIIDAHQCALTFANATKQTILEDLLPLVAWNTPLPFASLWRNSMVENQADTSHGFEPHQLMSSMLTSPELLWSDYGAASLFGRNDTLLLLNDDVEVAEPVIRSWFWRKPIRLPFLRSRLPSKRPSYLHSLPSSDSAQADDSNPFSSSLPLPSESNKRCCTTSPLVLPSRRRLKLVTPRLYGTALSSNIQKNAAASMITQTTRPPKQFVKQQVIAARIKRTYYSSSYPLEEQNGGKSVFDEMDLVHEFVWEVLLRFRQITLGG